LFASFGIRVSFGSYITAWEQEFGISRTLVTSISFLSFITLAIAQPLSGKLNDRHGARTVLTLSMLLIGVSLLLCSLADQLWQLTILYGVLLSLGLTGGSNITVAAVITRWFTSNRGLAIGISLSGMAVGQLAVVPLSLYLISSYGWRYTMGGIGVIVLLVFMPLMLLCVRSAPEDIGLQPYGESFAAPDPGQTPALQTGAGGESIVSLLRQRVFWLITAPYFICGFTDIGLMNTHYIPFSQGKGISVGVIAFSFSLIAVANIFGTIGTGHLADRWNRSRLLAVIYGVRGGSFLLLLVADRPWLFVVFAVIYGMSEMASIAPVSSLCSHVFRKNSIGMVFGLVSVSHQLGGAVGSLVPGIIYDASGSYTPVLIMAMLLLAASGLLVARVPDVR
jgi:MFS family permease